VKTNRRESQVQAGVLAYLSTRGDCMFWRSNVQAGTAPSGRFMRSGVKGQPDVMVVKDGKFYGLEVKRSLLGKLSEHQRRWGNNLRAAGGVYEVVTSVSELPMILGPVGARLHLERPKRVYSKGSICTCTCTSNYVCPDCSRNQ